MKHKLRGIGVQLVISFVIAIMIPTLILAFEAINTTKTTQESNINITSGQPLSNSSWPTARPPTISCPMPLPSAARPHGACWA